MSICFSHKWEPKTIDDAEYVIYIRFPTEYRIGDQIVKGFEIQNKEIYLKMYKEDATDDFRHKQFVYIPLSLLMQMQQFSKSNESGYSSTKYFHSRIEKLNNKNVVVVIPFLLKV